MSHPEDGETRDLAATRRDSLKIIGAIGTTCAFPFSAEELYGQHEHESEPPRRLSNLSAQQFETLSRLADLIIPPTDTPGAVGAGVPLYIDYVLGMNSDLFERVRDGLEWLDHASVAAHGQPFGKLTEAQQVAILTPLSEAVDRGQTASPGERFFRVVKSLTADGYYTSRVGLLEELRYRGNTAMDHFPECKDPEHR